MFSVVDDDESFKKYNEQKQTERPERDGNSGLCFPHSQTRSTKHTESTREISVTVTFLSLFVLRNPNYDVSAILRFVITLKIILQNFMQHKVL